MGAGRAGAPRARPGGDRLLSPHARRDRAGRGRGRCSSRPRARAPGRTRRPSSPSGCCRPWSRGGSACLPARPRPRASPRRRRGSFAGSRGGPGATSSVSRARSSTICRPTTSRRCRSRRPRGGPRRRTSGSPCSRRSPPTTSAGSGLVDMADRLEAALAVDRAPRALPRASLQLVRHERPRAARAPLRVHGRQRQPRRAPDHAQAGLPRAPG